MNPRVLLIVDVPGWAFDNIAQNIKRHLSSRYEFEIAYMADFVGKPSEFIELYFVDNKFDILHFFWRDDLRAMVWTEHLQQAAANKGIPVETVIDAVTRPVITMSIYDHLHLSENSINERIEIFHFSHGYSVSSDRLEDIYRKHSSLPAPDMVITDGVRVDLFAPKKPTHPNVLKPLIIGWVGNSHWGDHSYADAKGLHTILKPAISVLKSEGIQINSHFADIQKRKRSSDEMVDYYSEIDVLICASLMEGTPNPVLEAMAAGVAIVSTDVGVVREALGTQQQDFILAERSVDAMVKALRKLAEDRSLLADLKAENLASIQKWDWSQKTDAWPTFWDIATNRRNEVRTAHVRRERLKSKCVIETLARADIGTLIGMQTPKPLIRHRVRAVLARQLYRHPRLARVVNKLRGRSS